ncbi:MAG: lysine-sensitive aspartokinase 3, partial [Bryobacteraceae bacterium]|nr:lysine-sensitive aspartokinase 3 [Bryobacteraceae bacterium]
MIVMKFGGSSVESATALERVAGIIGRYVDRKPVVVVSAMGKTTNKLLAIGAEAAAGRSEKVQQALQELKQYHLDESRP